MIPIIRVSDKMEGYAFLVIDYSQEHNLLFTCAMDDGEIWTLTNKEIRFCKNISLERYNINSMILFYIQLVLAVICWVYMVTYVYIRLKDKYGKKINHS